MQSSLNVVNFGTPYSLWLVGLRNNSRYISCWLVFFLFFKPSCESSDYIHVGIAGECGEWLCCNGLYKRQLEGQALPTVVSHSVFFTLLTKISIVQGTFLFNRAACLPDRQHSLWKKSDPTVEV